MNKDNSIENIVCAIQINSAKMEVLSKISNKMERRKKAKAFVIAECAAQRIKLSKEEISFAAHQLV